MNTSQTSDKLGARLQQLALKVDRALQWGPSQIVDVTFASPAFADTEIRHTLTVNDPRFDRRDSARMAVHGDADGKSVRVSGHVPHASAVGGQPYRVAVQRRQRAGDAAPLRGFDATRGSEPAVPVAGAFVDIFTPSIEQLLVTFFPRYLSQLEKKAPPEGILSLIDPDLLSELSSELIHLGVKMVLIKLGERGAYLRTCLRPQLEKMGHAKPDDVASWENFEGWAPCFQVEVVGTTGSGDSTIAGFLSGLLRGYSPIETLTAAVAVGACNCEAADALGGLCSWDNTLQRILLGWARKPLDLSTSTWTWSEKSEIWLKEPK